MSGGLTIDFDYTANNIQSYIDQGNFYDIIDENDIPTVLEKTNLNPNDFQTLLSQGKTKYNSSKIYGFVRKCNVSVNSFEDVINVLDSYKSILKLKSSGNLIDYLNQYKTDFNTLENENNKFKEEINQLKNEIATLNNKNNEQLQNEVSTLLKQNAQLMDDIFKCHNENNKLQQSISKIAKLIKMPMDFEMMQTYNYLKQISDDGNKLIMILSCACGLSEKKGEEGYTTFLWACVQGDLQLVRSLIEADCDKDVANANGFNGLLLASFYGHLGIVQYLIDNGFSKNWRDKERGMNAIFVASMGGKLEVVKYLHSIGCDVNSKQKDGGNCIFTASQQGHLDVVKYLVSVGGNPNEKNFLGVSPIYAATFQGHLEVVKYLVSIGANPNEQDKTGNYPINIASQKGYLEIVKFLVQSGCNKNEKGLFNVTPLMIAVSEGRFEVVEYLVSIHANLNDKDCMGLTPLYYAKQKQNQNENHKKILNLLVQAGAQ